MCIVRIRLLYVSKNEIVQNDLKKYTKLTVYILLINASETTITLITEIQN